MHHFRFSYYVALAAACLFLALPLPALAAGGSGRVFVPIATNGSSGGAAVSSDLSNEEKEILQLTNDQRVAAGCAPLVVSPKLMTAARNHSRDMAEHTSMSHIGSDGSTFVDRFGRVDYDWKAAAENVAAGYETPSSVMNGWMNSNGHRKNILNCAFTEIGIGYAYSEESRSTYWTQDFGTPR